MAFDAEDINRYFDQLKEDSFPANTSFRQHPNFQIAYDYLTGKSNSLYGLTTGQENYNLQGITMFLKGINPPAVNDNLVLDILTHPDVYPFVQQALGQWLVVFTVQNKTSSAIAAASSIFQSLGRNNDEIFFLYVYVLQYNNSNYDQLIFPDSEIKKYLLTIIPQQLTYGHPFSWVGWGSGWNNLYFRLIEEGRPHLAEEYILNGLLEDREDITVFIFNYKEGKYIPTILGWLKKPEIRNNELEAKFLVAIRLYEKDKQQFEPLIINLSKKYLAYFKQFRPDENWQRRIHISLLEGEESVYIAYSAAAIHFLILKNKEQIKLLIQDWFTNKVIVSFDVLSILFFHLNYDALPYLKSGLRSGAFIGGLEYSKKIIDLLQKGFQPTNYLDAMWEVASTKSRPLREYVAKLLAENDTSAEQRAIKLLENKSAEARQTAALILSFFNSEKALNAIRMVINVEANDNARDILLQITSATLPVKTEKHFIGQMIEAAAGRSKLIEPIEPWLNESELPSLFYNDGRKLDQLEVRFLFYRMSRVKVMRSDIEAKYIIDLLDKNRSALFAKLILQLFIDRQAKPEFKYLMALAALLGNDETVDKLRSIINGWIDINRSKMAEYGVGALALQGSNKALRLVELYSRKYKNKAASVGKAALRALEDAAEELGISTHELGDRIVPDFGFEGLFKHFTVNGEAYRAFIDSNFKLAFFNEDNKKLKTLPPTADKELKEEFKNIVKEVKDVVKSQSLRLEYYLIIQQKWTSEEWEKFYLTNPVMFIYAARLLWGRYNKGGQLLSCFICLEDTSLINFNDEEIMLDEDVLIGIVHPIQLIAQDLQIWNQKFFDLSIEPIFPQLNRPVAIVKEDAKNKKIDFQFERIETETGSIKSTLEKHGWRKGETGDGGYIDHFRFQNSTNNTEAVLEVEGVFVGGYGFDSQPKLGRLYFIDKKKEPTQWFLTPKDEKDERLISFGSIPDIFYSEVVGSVLAIRRKAEVLP